jgi:hypothetical protein
MVNGLRQRDQSAQAQTRCERSIPPLRGPARQDRHGFYSLPDSLKPKEASKQPESIRFLRAREKKRGPCIAPETLIDPNFILDSVLNVPDTVLPPVQIKR